MATTWKQMSAFFALTILLLALVPILSLTTGASMDFDAVAASATEKTGIAQTSNLLVVLRLCVAEPGLLLLVLGSCVPSLAAIVVCAWGGRQRLAQLFSTFHPYRAGTSLKQALGAYGTLFVVIPLGLLATFALRSVWHGPEAYTQPEGIFGPTLIVALLVAAFLDQGGVLEELGWRGFGQLSLQSKWMTPLNAALMMGIAWGLWHVPRDVFAGVITRLGPTQYLFMYLPSFVLGTIAASVIAAYFMNRVGGSVLAAIMVHGLINDAPGLAGPATINIALTPHHQITQAIPFLVIAAGIVLVAGKELGRAKEDVPPATD